MECVFGTFWTRLGYYSLALSRGERILDGGVAALMDEGPAANEAQAPSEEVPADAENKDPYVIMKVEAPVNEGPAAPASTATPEVALLAGMGQEVLLGESQQLYRHFWERLLHDEEDKLEPRRSFTN